MAAVVAGWGSRPSVHVNGFCSVGATSYSWTIKADRQLTRMQQLNAIGGIEVATKHHSCILTCPSRLLEKLAWAL